MGLWHGFCDVHLFKPWTLDFLTNPVLLSKPCISVGMVRGHCPAHGPEPRAGPVISAAQSGGKARYGPIYCCSFLCLQREGVHGHAALRVHTGSARFLATLHLLPASSSLIMLSLLVMQNAYLISRINDVCLMLTRDATGTGEGQAFASARLDRARLLFLRHGPGRFAARTGPAHTNTTVHQDHGTGN